MSIISDELIKLGGGANAYKGMRLISPTYASTTNAYENGIHFTWKNHSPKNINALQNIFNLHIYNDTYSKDYTNIYPEISLDKSVKKLCKVEFYPGRAYQEAIREYYPSFNGWSLYIKNKNQIVYKLENMSYIHCTDNKQKYYNNTALCYHPQIISIPDVTFDFLSLRCEGSNYSSNANHYYQSLVYLKFYQRITDSYLILFLSDNNLYKYNEDNTYTKILSLEEWNNKTKSEKEELLSKIQSPDTITGIDKNILNKFKIIKLK